jgi:hypothetical protein
MGEDMGMEAKNSVRVETQQYRIGEIAIGGETCRNGKFWNENAEHTRLGKVKY